MKWVKKDCYGDEQIWYSSDVIENLIEDLKNIRDCATTEMVEISTRNDYDGFLALKGISAKITKMLKDIEESEDK